MLIGALLVFIGVSLFAAQLVRPAHEHPRLARRAASAAPPARSPATTPGAIRSARRRPRRAHDRPRARDARRHAGGRHRAQPFQARSNELFTATTRSRRRTTSIRFRSTAAEAAAKTPGVTAVGSVRTGDALVLRQDDLRDGGRSGDQQGDLARLGGRLAGDVRQPRARTVRSSTRTTRRTTTCEVGSPIDVTFTERRHQAVLIEGHLRPADGWLTVRPRHDLRCGLGCEQLRPAQPLLVREDGGWRDGREHSPRSTSRSKPFPNAKAQTRQDFIDNQISGLKLDPEHPLRPARAVDRDQPLRDRQHARADRVRAHARDRHAARDRHDATPDAAHDPARERDHGADRGGVRDRARARARAAS